jgi:thiamine-phosphate pyrophosphorylase
VAAGWGIAGLYPITDASAGPSHLEQVEAFVRGGARIVQIRDKRAGGGELYEIAVAALGVTRPAGALLVVNDRVDVALAARADGVHVGQEDLSPEAAREILGPDAIVGFSTHSPEQARAASSLPIDYVAIGPVYATATKENPDPVVGLEGVRAVREIVTLPLVAIGGITLERARAVLDAGADALAVVGDLRSTGSAVGSIERRVRDYVDAMSGSRE